MRYRIDDLGWYHFEMLVQSVLKAECGLLVQSWGGHSDLGRDAYANEQLVIRGRHITGPTVFQAKFVQAANAAGAKWKPLLLKAVREEASRIEERIEDDESWTASHYFLVTNAPVDADVRGKIESILRGPLATTTIISLGGADLCDLLDEHPALRRSFPEILSLRDLDALLIDAVNRGVLARSQAAIEESRDLVPVFVPTAAYDRTWKVLEKHSFAVLDGPPEMGKTAIARAVALGHVLSQWQAIECRGPDDFFAAYDEHGLQIFIADDAFGRTEFDPTLARAWERDLPRIFLRLGVKHRLIWTTRKHILQRALREMDLTGKAKLFPDPGEIIVTADDLTLEEKTRILYRHGKQAEIRARLAIRRTAKRVVNHPHFTPERIRRAVTEVMTPVFLDMAEREPLKADEILLKSVKDPTSRMRKSFQRLTGDHQLILVALLDAGYFPTDDVLYTKFAALRGGSRPVFDIYLDDLIGTFVKRRAVPLTTGEEIVSWIHPSYRDLVIDELVQRPELRRTFVLNASPQGVALAVSESGGGEGQREFPLLGDPASIDALVERCRQLATTGDQDDALETLETLCSAIKGGRAPASVAMRLPRAATEVATLIVQRWCANEALLDGSELISYFKLAKVFGDVPLPPIESVWVWLSEVVGSEIDDGEMDSFEIIARWSRLRDVIDEYYTAFAESERFRQIDAATSQRIFDFADEWSGRRPATTNYDDPEHEANRLSAFSDLVMMIDRDGDYLPLSERLTEASDEFKALIPEESDLSFDRESPESSEFSVDEFFADL
jgi:hypothetical protein